MAAYTEQWRVFADESVEITLESIQEAFKILLSAGGESDPLGILRYSMGSFRGLNIEIEDEEDDISKEFEDFLDEIDATGHVDNDSFKDSWGKATSTPEKKKECHCGLDSSGCGGEHADYCPKYEDDNEK